LSIWKRGFLEIIGEILSCILNNPLKKTGINSICKLDSRLITKYLSIMESFGFVKKDVKDSSFYAITQKGIDFLYQYEMLVEMIEKDLKKLKYA